MIILKRIISTLLAIVMLFAVMNVSAFAADETPTAVQESITKMQKLDADKDGTYTTGDVSAVLKAAAGIAEDSRNTAYDINGDGYVSLRDAHATLNAVTGVTPVVTQDELLAVFNERLNSVKKTLPGFTKREIAQCSSILVTTKNSRISSLNVTDLEFDKYVEKLISVTNSLGSFAGNNSELKAEIENMKAAAENAYKPQSRSVAVGKGEDYEGDHIDLFVVGGLTWSSNLKMSDIKAISYTMTGGRFVFTITMNNYSYTGNEYPTGVAGLAERAKLPYGKAFNLPEFDESDGSKVNSVALRDGKIEFAMDYETSDVLKVEYTYEYTADIQSPPDTKTGMEMKTKTTAEMTERYIVNRVTQ